MLPKRASLAIIASIISLISYGPALEVEAAPIDRLLSFISSSQSQHQELPTDTQLLQTPPRPSLGRAQIRPIQREAHPPFSNTPPTSSSSSASSSSSSSHPSSYESSTAVWYLLHRQQQGQQQQPLQPPAIPTNPQEPQPQSTDESNSWSYRTLNGHAVLDDDDDDAGNELLDTEADEFLRPDADDEVEGTIEGEVLEEEGDEEEEDELGDEEVDAIWAGVVEQISVLKSQLQGEVDTDEALLVEKAFHDGDFE
ncbi:hypothetical protein KVV02_002449 [Mortierella alpina]|uniref:Uncharacterized protein n=1 Tax=Mortierella alpina TaxID=64518 RepID=A0A9P7ZXH9_MORAP|nr:hypothetical protein KVV02_002449 [Mortierella alpina]